MQKKLSIPEDFKLKITYRNPMFNKIGTFSMPGRVHVSDAKKMGFTHNIENTGNSQLEIPAQLKMHGANVFKGNLIITETDNSWYQYHFESGKGQFAAAIKDVYMTDIEYFDILTDEPANSYQRYVDLTNSVRAEPFFRHAFCPVYMPEWVDETYGYPTTDFLNKWDMDNEMLFNDSAYVTLLEDVYQTCPFFYLTFVIDMIFEKYGYLIITNELKQHEELNNLLVIHYNPDHSYNGSPSNEYYISFQQNLPKIKISEFISNIENLLCLSFFINDATKEVSIKFRKNIINQVNYKDISKFATPYYSKQLNEKKGVTLQIKTDNEDIRTKTKTNFTIEGEVDTFDELPVVTDINDIYLVISEKKLYRFQATVQTDPYISSSIDWEFYSYLYQDYTIENGKTVISTKASTLFMDTVNNMSFPVSKFKRYNTGYEELLGESNETSNSLFLLLYGQADYDSQNGKYYPYAYSNPYYININGDWNKVYNKYLALIWQTDEGLYENFWKEYIHWLINIKQEVTRELNILPKHLEQLDFSQKYRIGNTNYFINSIPVTYTPKNIEIGEVSLLKA